MIPPGLLFSLMLLSADGWGQFFPKWPPPEKHMLLNIPETIYCLQYPSPTMSHSKPLFSQEILQELQSGLTQIPMESLLCHWTQCIWKPVCIFQEWVSISPSHMELLSTSPTGLQCQMLWGLFLLMLDPQAWGPDVEFRTLTPVGESLWYSYFPVCGLPTQQVGGCLYHIIIHPTILMWPPLCLLEEDIFFWKFLVHLVEGCSSFGCNSVVFMRGGLQSFYSTILILSPRSTFKLGTLDGKTMELIFHFDGDFSVQSEVVLHGVLWWLSVLRICCCHWSSSSYCCGVGWILGLENFTCHGHDKKKKKVEIHYIPWS